MKLFHFGSALLALGVFSAHLCRANAQPVVDVRSIDGSGNNLSNTQWGAVGSALQRTAATSSSTGAFYPGDGSGSIILGGPGSTDSMPNPRDVSNHLYYTGVKDRTSRRGLSNMLWQWGQFLDHDITLVEPSPFPGDFVPIPVPPGDPMSPMIPFQRSQIAAGTGTSAANPRQQVNSISAYIDASNIYGSDTIRQMELRDIGNGGRMKTSMGNMLPYNTTGLPNAGGTDSSLFLSGDVRANEQVGLTAMHTLFVREHNRLADMLAGQNPSWSDDALYNTSRAIVGAEMQAITYREFLPALLGKRNAYSLAPAHYQYDDTANAGISNEFSTAIYRFGHSMLPEELKLARVHGSAAGSLPLMDAFFDPTFLGSDADGSTRHMDQILLGLSTSVAQEIDTKVTDAVRNFLFGAPGSGGMDLAALNIQRNRDHGLPSYNDTRIAYGLSPALSFRDITGDRKVRRKLRQLYDSVDDIDSWVGALAEDHIRGGSVGELVYASIVEQFTDLRDGDRFFYTGDSQLMGNTAIDAVIDLDDISLSDIIAWNTPLHYVPDNVFFAHRSPFNNFFDGFHDTAHNIGDFWDDFRTRFDSHGNPQGGIHVAFVPEPSSGLMMLLGSLGCLCRCRGRV